MNSMLTKENITTGMRVLSTNPFFEGIAMVTEISNGHAILNWGDVDDSGEYFKTHITLTDEGIALANTYLKRHI